MEVREQLQKALAKFDADNIAKILDVINPKILAESRDLRTEILMLKLYKLIRDKSDPVEIIELATHRITPEIKLLVSTSD